MAKETIKYVLNGQLTDNMVTRDVKDDKILTLVAAGTADKQRVISEIMADRTERLLKAPRSVKQTIYLGEVPEGSPGGSSGGGSGEHGEAPDPAG